MNDAADALDWPRANQLALMAEIAAVGALLARHGGQTPERAPPATPNIISALDRAAECLALSSFERKIVVMCAAIELEAGFAALCGLSNGDCSRAYPTFGLALAAFADAHWSALTPAGALRRFGLIEVQPGASLTAAALRIYEAFLHELAGIVGVDGRLAAFVAPLPPPIVWSRANSASPPRSPGSSISPPLMAARPACSWSARTHTGSGAWPPRPLRGWALAPLALTLPHCKGRRTRSRCGRVPRSATRGCAAPASLSTRMTMPKHWGGRSSRAFLTNSRCRRWSRPGGRLAAGEG
jgi:hypothetical protein